MKFFRPTKFKVFTSLVVFVLLLAISLVISTAILPNPNNVLGIMAKPDLTPTPSAGISAQIGSNMKLKPDTLTVVLHALSPYKTSYFPRDVAFARYMLLISLYVVSFIVACIIAGGTKRQVKKAHATHHRKR